MALEIERKFLVKSNDYLAGSPVVIIQGYLSMDHERVVRVRRYGVEAWLTVKGRMTGIERLEFEIPVNPAEADEMLESLCIRPLIRKTRYLFRDLGQLWEVDVFEGENEGLVVAELELPSADAEFLKPSWVGEEVSGDPRYLNSNLVLHPFNTWPRTPFGVPSL